MTEHSDDDSIEFDRVDGFIAGAVGVPGHRTFYVQARVGDATAIFKMEKEQVAMLGRYLGQVVGTMGGAEPDRDVVGLDEPVTPLWTVGTISALVDEDSQTIQITAEELTLEDDLDEFSETFDDPSFDPDEFPLDETEAALADELEELLGMNGRTVRITLSLGQAVAFAEQAEELVAAGRPPCRLCGRPIEPGGHDCPRWN
ncbi:MAG: DUF3090 family protein [Actinomycetes bacterium]